MNLDNLDYIQQLDPQNMLAEIDGLPQQLETAWALGNSQPQPAVQGITRVVIAGMGGSAIGADLLTSYAAPLCLVPVYTHRDYGLPAWAAGPETLVIASSHSGNTEETLHAFQTAVERGCTLFALSTGGKLVDAAQNVGATVWTFQHTGQPRAAVGYSFGLLLALFARLGLLPDPAAELAGAHTAMQAQQEQLRVEIPVAQNLAKRQAGQMVGRWVSVIGAEILSPVARRWKGQISELAKAWGQFEFLPEANHNTLAGIINPEAQLERMITLFLTAPSYNPRNRLRMELTREGFMLEGIATDTFTASGPSRLAHLWTTLHFGDYLAYYLAVAYGVDPTPVEALERFKAEMKVRGE